MGLISRVSSRTYRCLDKMANSGPELIIFDYNDTLVTPFEVTNLPEFRNAIRNGETGLVDKISCGDTRDDDLNLLPEITKCLQLIKNSSKLTNCKLAIASTSYTIHTENCTKASLKIFEVEKNFTIQNLLDRNWNLQKIEEKEKEAPGHLQIGRRPPLSTDKSIHINNIRNFSENDEISLEKIL